ncbi:hypothetical protein [uncultured Clostridium sp.]|uniref:hypothetical protein n=1 Tax=uncultured Clostridium sp. TaxID=59620 RepID=UPI00262C3154|nr:hypothetical protein [uncultured Clostridium sp.]
MINKSYLYNVPSKNILNDYTPKNLSNDTLDNYPLDSIENMVMNSNLNTDESIK